MTNISSIMNTSLSALQTQQAAIAITGQNIANATTEGYSQQKVVISNSSSGTTSASAKRVYSSFLTKQLNGATETLGKHTTESKYMDSVETIFNESDGSGLSDDLSNFFNTWSDVANAPSDSSARSILLSYADTLANTFNSVSSDLTGVQKNIDGEMGDLVDQVNEDTQQISTLNQQIAQGKASGQDVSSFQDSLDSLVNDLSSLVNIKSYTNDSGQICIQLSNGKPLVDGTTAYSLSTQTNATTGLQDVTWVDQSGNATVVTSAISSGQLGGCLNVRDTVIPGYLDQLNTLATSIMTSVNNLQTSGYDLDGTAGVAFFTGTSAADMAVNTTVAADTNKIAASASTSDKTDGSVAKSMAKLQDSLLLNSGTSTFSDYYSELVSKVGADTQAADDNYSSQSDAVSTYKGLKKSVTSVNSDEEDTNLMMYQSSYAAAAKVMTVLDELLKTLISM